MHIHFTCDKPSDCCLYDQVTVSLSALSEQSFCLALRSVSKKLLPYTTALPHILGLLNQKLCTQLVSTVEQMQQKGHLTWRFRCLQTSLQPAPTIVSRSVLARTDRLARDSLKGVSEWALRLNFRLLLLQEITDNLAMSVTTRDRPFVRAPTFFVHTTAFHTCI